MVPVGVEPFDVPVEIEAVGVPVAVEPFDVGAGPDVPGSDDAVGVGVAEFGVGVDAFGNDVDGFGVGVDEFEAGVAVGVPTDVPGGSPAAEPSIAVPSAVGAESRTSTQSRIARSALATLGVSGAPSS